MTRLACGFAPLILAASVIAAPLPAQAQNQPQSVAEFYRNKTITISIGYAPGGTYDMSARVLARYMSRHIPGEPAIVARSMPGAGSLKVANYLYNVAPRDGTEFGIFGRTIPMDPLFGGKEAQFDALKFTWLGSTSNEVSTCVAWHTNPVKTAADLFTKELFVGAAGAASPSAVFPYLFNSVLGMRFKVINGYPSSANSLVAMEAGELGGFCSWGWVAMRANRPDWIRDNKFNALFQIGLDKHAEHPDVPLILDFAKTPEDRKVLELVVAPQTFARPFAAPPNLPADRAAALRKAFDDTVKDPAFIEEATKLQLEPDLVTGARVLDILRGLYATPTPIVARARSAIQQ